jgi:L-alanine-DL-glutamate epimerase-like enolase superfamily enzyme
MKIQQLDVYTVEIPQVAPIAPYQNRFFPGYEAKSVLFRLATDTGLVGWGEAPQRILGNTILESAAGPLREKVIGWDPFDMERFFEEKLSEIDDLYLASGVEMAMWDLVGKECGQPLYKLLGGAVRKDIELAACMGIRPFNEASEIAAQYVEMGFSTIKTKAGRDPDEDLDMVRGLRDGAGDRLEIRIDPNRGYDPKTALQLARDLEPYHLQYLEQPMPQEMIAEAADLRAKTSTPIALNESVTTLEMVDTILNLGAADVILPDTQQCGGILAVKKVSTLAEAAGVPCVMHCSHDLGPKTATMLHVVASSPPFTLANDCTYYGLEDDILVDPFKIVKGHMRVPEKPGLGIEVDAKKLAKYRKPPKPNPM